MKEVEQYTGVGKPPHYDLILRGAMPDGSTPPDLSLPVTLTGVKQPTTITLEREAQTSVGYLFGSSEQEGKGRCFAIILAATSTLHYFLETKYLCQVFYHKFECINHWMATLAFFPENKHQVK